MLHFWELATVSLFNLRLGRKCFRVQKRSVGFLIPKMDVFSPAVFPWLMSPLIFIHRSPPMLGGYLRVSSPHWGVHSLLSGLRIATAFMQGSTRRLQYSSLSVEYVLTRTPGVANTGGFYTQHQDCSWIVSKLQVFVDALLTHIVLVLGPYYDIYTAL